MGRMGRGFVPTGRAGAPGARKVFQLPEPARAKLQEAWAKVKDGDFATAAATFGNLSDKGAEAGRHRMAVQLGLFAAFAAARGGDRDGAVRWAQSAAKHGQTLQNRTAVARRFGRLVHKLRAAGHEDDAAAIEAAVVQAVGVGKLPAHDPGAATVNRARRRMLPATCPTCAAPVAADAVEFDDEGADCTYCGVELLS